MTFLCMIALKNKTLAHTYLLSLSTMQVVEIQKCFFFYGNVTSQAFSCAMIKCGVNFH